MTPAASLFCRPQNCNFSKEADKTIDQSSFCSTNNEKFISGSEVKRQQYLKFYSLQNEPLVRSRIRKNYFLKFADCK